MKRKLLTLLIVLLALILGCKKTEPGQVFPSSAPGKKAPVQQAIDLIRFLNEGKKLEIVGWTISHDEDELTVYWHFFMHTMMGDVEVKRYKDGESMSFQRMNSENGYIWTYREGNEYIILGKTDPMTLRDSSAGAAEDLSGNDEGL